MADATTRRRAGAGLRAAVGAPVSATGLVLRRLRTERGLALLLLAMVASTSFLFAAAPRLLNRAADDGLASVVRAATPVQRDVTLAEIASSATSIGESVADVRAEGDRLAGRFPPALAALVADRTLRVTSVRLAVAKPPAYETTIALRYQDGLVAASRLVAGRWPVSTGDVLPFAEWNSGTPVGGPSKAPVRFEVAVSAQAAADTGIKVGDRLAVTLDGSDPMLGMANLRIAPTEIDVVGLFEPLDPTSAYWAVDGSLLHAVQVGTESRPSAQVTGAIAADAFHGIAASRLPLHDEWQFAIDPSRLDAGRLDELRADLRRMDFATGSELGVPDSAVLRTGLPTILDAYALQLAGAESLLALAAMGPLALGAAVLAMLAILAASRRRAGLALARGRGASGAQVLAAELIEGAVLAGIAGGVGLLAAVVAVPARPSGLSPLLALAVGGGTTALLAGASWPVWRPRARPAGNAPDRPPAAARRFVLEATFVLIALAGALLVRERGLAVPPTSGTGASGGAAPVVAAVNPLLSVIPALCGLAAGIVAVRLYPLPVRALGWLAARRRDLVPVLGLRSIGRHQAAAGLGLLVLMLTAASGAFASVVATSIERGQSVASYDDVGADYRVERTDSGALEPSLTRAVAPGAMPGVEAVAAGIDEPSAPFSSTLTQRSSIEAIALDPRAYAAVVTGTPIETTWPSEFLAEPPGGASAAGGAASAPGSEADPVPAILSTTLPGATVPLSPGATFHVTVLGHDLVARLVEQRATLAGVGDGPFALLPLAWVRAAIAAPSQPPTTLWVRGGPSAGEAVAAAITDPASTRLDSRYAALAALRDAPLATATATGFALALLVAGAFMALAIVGTVILSAARRNQDLAYLRTLGITRRQALALTLVEQAPPALMALVPGVALGVGLAFLLEPGLNLAAFEGLDGFPLAVDPMSLVLLGVVLLGVVVAAVLGGTWLSLRVRAADVLRMGEH